MALIIPRAATESIGLGPQLGPPCKVDGTMGRLAELAQLVEHLHGKEGVGGSSPPLGFGAVVRGVSQVGGFHGRAGFIAPLML